MARLGIPLTALLLLAPLAAEATIVRAVAFDEKVEQAEGIVVGTCIAQESRWDDAHERILTYSTFRVEKTLKGAVDPEITLVTPGGKVGNIVQEIIGVPRFREGEENVVFVRNTKAGPTVAFLEQGNYKVVKDARGDRMAMPAVTSSVLVDTGRGTAVAPESARSMRDLEGAVRDTIRRREALRMELIEQRKKEEASLWNQVQRNKWLIGLALLGAIIATWQLYKRW